MKNRKKIIITIICIILIIVIFFIFKQINHSKNYDMNKLNSYLTEEYYDLNIKKMDKIDILNDFGIDNQDVDDIIYLRTLAFDENGIKEEDDINIIVVINTENTEHYYDILGSYIDSNKLNQIEPDKIQLYTNAILKKGNNYVYMIVSNSADQIEKDLIALYEGKY